MAKRPRPLDNLEKGCRAEIHAGPDGPWAFRSLRARSAFVMRNGRGRCSRRPAKRGDPEGFYRLSELHRHGEDADSKEADRYLKLAANRGHAGAREMLGLNA